MDLMDDDPKTESYNQFMHLGAKITDANIARYQELFRKRKDRYRRWRDLSFFVMVGVYALSVVDAYVDASLNPTALNPYKPTGIGLQCSLTF